MSNENLLNQFYSSFQQKDYQTMARCYHPNATFKDEIFELKGKHIGAMWHMLCERGVDTEITSSDIKADHNKGSAQWEAKYTFSKSGRRVHNVIKASFKFKDGKIIAHQDRFSFWKWSGMALGMVGWLLGWTSFLRRKVSERVHKSLEKFIEAHPEYQ